VIFVMDAEHEVHPAAEIAAERAVVRDEIVAEVGVVPSKAESGREERENEPVTVVVAAVDFVAVAVAVAEAVAEAVAVAEVMDRLVYTPQVEVKAAELVLCVPNCVLDKVM